MYRVLGRAEVNGQTITVTPDFAKQAAFISQQLDVSERYVASLMTDIIKAKPNMSRDQFVEAVIIEFHLRRRELAECIRYIFEAAEVGLNTPDAPDLYTELEAYVRQRIVNVRPYAGLLIQEIERLGDTIRAVQVARQNARSNTIAPSEQGKSSLRPSYCFLTFVC